MHVLTTRLLSIVSFVELPPSRQNV